MNRYKNTKIKRDKQLKVRYKSTTEYPSIQRRDSDIVYYSKYGDTYSNLAYRFYQDQSLWWVIAKANEGFKGDIILFLDGVTILLLDRLRYISVLITNYLLEFC